MLPAAADWFLPLLLDSILNLLFPVACILCHSKVDERRWGPACPNCWAKLVPIPPPLCAQCGVPAVAIEGLCGLCRRGEHFFDFARSALVFDPTLREMLHHLKYSDRVSVARPLARILKECLDREGFTGNLLVPVPLHPARERERGFNQAELLAERLGRPVDARLLRRRKNTPSQTGLSRNQRKRNLAGAFELRRPVVETLIVVDDVYTTGSTMNEIARTLKGGGAKRVEILTVARVVREIYTNEEGTDTSAGSVSNLQ